MSKIKIPSPVLTTKGFQRVRVYVPSDRSIPVSGMPVSKDRATRSILKNAISINVYGPSTTAIYCVDAEKLAPIVLRFISELDALCQANSALKIT